jgi:hypothetical protein
MLKSILSKALILIKKMKRREFSDLIFYIGKSYSIDKETQNEIIKLFKSTD